MQQMCFVNSYALNKNVQFVSERVQSYVRCVQYSRKTVLHPRSLDSEAAVAIVHYGTCYKCALIRYVMHIKPNTKTATNDRALKALKQKSKAWSKTKIRCAIVLRFF